MDPVTTTIDHVFCKNLGKSLRINDLSIDATSKLAVIGGEKGLCVVNLDQPDEEIVFKKAKSEVGKLECNPHTTHAQYVAATAATQLILWDLSAERSMLSLMVAHNRNISGLSWSRHNPALLATSSIDATVCLWDTRLPKTPSRISTYNTHSFSSTHVEFHPTKENIIASSHGGYVRIWDTRNTNSAQVANFPAHMSDITAIHWSDVGAGALLTGSQDKHVKIWNLPPYNNNPQCGSTTHAGQPVSFARFIPNSSRYLLTSHYSNSAIYLWAAGNLTPQVSLTAEFEPPVSFDLRRAGSDSFVVSVAKDFCLRMWPLPNIEDDTKPLPAIASSPHPHRKLHENEFVPLSLDLELARVKQNSGPGFHLSDIDYVKRSCIISFTTKAHGKFELQVTLPTMYPHNAPPIFEFVTTPNLLSHSINQTKIDIKHQLDEVAAEHVLHDKPCLGACLETLSKWVHKNLGELALKDEPPPLPPRGRDRSKSSPIIPSPLVTGVLPFASPPVPAATTHHTVPVLPPPPSKVPAGCVADMHTVTSSQTLMGIAIQYDMAPALLKKLNRLYSNQVIAGQQLWVFKKSESSESKPPSITVDSDQPTPISPEALQLSLPPKTRSLAVPQTKDIQLMLQPTEAETSSPYLSASFATGAPIYISPKPRRSWGGAQPPLSLVDVIKEKLECWSPSFFVCGELTLTRQLLVFEPSTDDPFVMRGGVVQFQLCVELTQICSVRFFRSPTDWAKRTARQNSDSNILDNKDEPENINKMRFPCIEVSMLVGKVLQTRQFRDLPEEKLESLCTTLKLRVVDSHNAATVSGLVIPNFQPDTPSVSPNQNPVSALRTSSSFLKRSSSLLRVSAAADDPLPSLTGSTQLLVDYMRVKKLRSILPRRLQSADWEMLFCTVQDGFNLHTFYSRVRNTSPSLIIIEDSVGHVFGALVTEAWDPGHEGYYGTGESLLFKLHPEFKVYKWTKKNDFFMYSNSEELGLGGGGGGFGLWIDVDLDNGSSNESATFGNECIASGTEFRCTLMEAWGFSQ